MLRVLPPRSILLTTLFVARKVCRGWLCDKTRKIAIQLVLEQCCKTDCMFFCWPLCCTFRTVGIKAMSRSSLRGANKWHNLPMQEIKVEFVYSKQQKWRTCHLRNENGKLMEVIIATFLNTNGTADVLTASSNDVKLVEARTVHFAWLSNLRLVLKE